MKNIHVLPTDKPSRLYLTTKEYIFEKEYSLSTDECQNKHIYITCDEEIKKGDWYWLEKIGRIGSESGAYKSSSVKVSKLNTLASNCKKIILTTDQDLIKDGVQAIDDEFLEWFVKNTSCEKVLVTNLYGDFNPIKYDYKIIIPKKEPKQETLEEFAEKFIKKQNFNSLEIDDKIFEAILFGAKWQQEKMYSDITRVEVIQHSDPHNGRAYVNYDAREVQVQLQDDGKTLKIFLK